MDCKYEGATVLNDEEHGEREPPQQGSPHVLISDRKHERAMRFLFECEVDCFEKPIRLAKVPIVSPVFGDVTFAETATSNS